MKFYGQFDPPQDQVLYERYFKNFSGKGVCLECGAVDGVNLSSTKFFEETLGWMAINIEVHPNSFKKLITNRPNSININIALSDIKGNAKLVTGVNFFLRAYVTTREKKDGLHIERDTYKNVVDQLPIDHIDLMVLDVEGHEVRALTGMKDSRLMPNILCVEINHSNKIQLKELIESMGYKFDSSIYINDVYIKRR